MPTPDAPIRNFTRERLLAGELALGAGARMRSTFLRGLQAPARG